MIHNRDLHQTITNTQLENCLGMHQVTNIAQGIIHYSNNSRTKLPKHIGRAQFVCDLTLTRLFITLLSKMGHC